MAIKWEIEDRYGWSRWMRTGGNRYRLSCCTCGLTHDFEFRRRGLETEFRASRNRRSTAQVRRSLRGNNAG